MMKGSLDFLTSNAPAAQHLRQEFVVFVIPMLNPDGKD
jgi:murein tripeptide amidase MpaA